MPTARHNGEAIDSIGGPQVLSPKASKLKTTNPSAARTITRPPSRRMGYGAIYADPPWSFKTYSAKGTGRSAVSHYDCMELADIRALPVATLAATDCALFLWVTKPMFPAGLEVMKAWGFEYKTIAFSWAKANKLADLERLSPSNFFMGLGYWTRANVELCLLGTRGHPTRLAGGVRELVISPVREHSRKPDEVRERITQLVPGPYLEMFARETTLGWDSWGDQAGLFDGGPIKTRRQPSDLTKVDKLARRGILGARRYRLLAASRKSDRP